VKYIRLVLMETRPDGTETFKDIVEFEGGIEDSQIFRIVSGTCTRLFSRKLKEFLEQPGRVYFEKGEKE